MFIIYLVTLAIVSAVYFGVVRPHVEKTTGKKYKGWDSFDDELPYVIPLWAAWGGLNFFATVACYYFDLGIEVSAEDVRHSISMLFSFWMGLAFFGFFLPRVLHFRYNGFTFSRPPSKYGALFLIMAAFVAIWPLMKYVAELITKGFEIVLGVIV